MKKIYGLIGFPLGHSFSKGYFNEKFAKEDINAAYRNFPLESIEQLPALIASEGTWGEDSPTGGEDQLLAGLNVTIPYKQTVISFLTDLDDTAKEIGAVNVIKIFRDASGGVSALKGYNSDCIGFIESIKGLLRPWHKKALVLGTGGASKAVAFGLRQLGVEPVYVSRKDIEGGYSYNLLHKHPDIVSEHTVIVNTTPLGMYPNVVTCPDLPYDHVTDRHLCYDVVYNPEVTLFMRMCAQTGAVTKCGLEMLHKQAIGAWEIWNK